MTDAACTATVVITTHNRPDLARRALASALAQTVDVEVVVVDDGSVPPFEPHLDDARVRVIRRAQAGGVSVARNLGLQSANGAWITFLDDDDVLLDDMLAQSIDAAEQSTLPRPIAVLSAVTIVGVDGQDLQTIVPVDALEKGKDFFLEGRGGAGRAGPTLVAPTSVLRAIGGFDEEVEVFEHDDLGLRLNRVASIQGTTLPRYRMTTHPGARLSGRTQAIPRSLELTLAKHPGAFSRHRVAHARFMATTSYYHLKAGNWADALRWSLRAVLRNPADRRVWFFLACAVAGPYAARAYRRLNPTESTVSFSTLTARRMRKVARRAWDHVLAVIVVPTIPITWAALRRRVPPGVSTRSRRVLLICIYRQANARWVVPLVRDADGRGWDVRLWALDASAPELASRTIGVGSGDKFPLLDELLAGVDLDGPEWLVVTDDDLVFERGGVDDVLAVAEAAHLDLVQPAHTERSHREHEFARRRPLTLARGTTFVEIGPLFAVRAPWIAQVAPFPPGHTMGWGLELEWADLAARGAQLGIVDAVPVRHLGRVGAAYAKPEQRARLRALLDARGLGDIRATQRTLGVWRCWQRVPWGR